MNESSHLQSQSSAKDMANFNNWINSSEMESLVSQEA